jgi:hypothetical protein
MLSVLNKLNSKIVVTGALVLTIGAGGVVLSNTPQQKPLQVRDTATTKPYNSDSIENSHVATDTQPTIATQSTSTQTTTTSPAPSQGQTTQTSPQTPADTPAQPVATTLTSTARCMVDTDYMVYTVQTYSDGSTQVSEFGTTRVASYPLCPNDVAPVSRSASN